MKISRLLELHRQSNPAQSLVLNFGDGFLLHNNSIYRNVRTRATALGFNYTKDVSPEYLALPLSQLTKILQEKSIPYFDNVSVLNEVERKIPQTTMWDEVRDNLKRNFVFHESCHAVSNDVGESIFVESVEADLAITRFLIEESFSNACELLGIGEAEQTAHRSFYEANSYIFMYEDRVLIKELIDELGGEFLCSFMIICYLHSNFLVNRLEDKGFDRVIALIAVSSLAAKQIKKLRALSKIAFELNPRFREVTTGFYLRLCGMKSEKKEMQNINFMRFIETDPRFLKMIKILASSI